MPVDAIRSELQYIGEIHRKARRLIANATARITRAGEDAEESEHIDPAEPSLVDLCAEFDKTPLHSLVEIFELNSLESEIVALCFAVQSDSQLRDLLPTISPTGGSELTLGVLRNLFGASPARLLEFYENLESDSRLVRNGIVLLRPSNSTDASTLEEQPLVMPDRFVAFLLGSKRPDSALFRFLERVEMTNPASHVDALSPAQVEALGQYLYSGNCEKLAYLHGPEGAGHEVIAASVAELAGSQLLRVNTRRLIKQPADLAERIIDGIFREARLLNASLIIPNAEELLSRDAEGIRESLCFATHKRPVIFFTGVDPIDLKLFSEKGNAIEIELSAPAESERKEVWRSLLNDEIEAIIEELAARYRFTTGQIETAINFASMEAVRRGDLSGPNRADLIAGCRMTSNRKLAELAKRIDTNFGWEDLVLSDATKDNVKAIVRSYRKQGSFLEGWGFGRRFQYGRGISVLFGGASGTGKTMAASVIARELDLELYKIDLSRVISKYIGETEKNLSRLFREAETSNAILFFDEADALFGKRSEVKDSHDRHANIEIDYLLQQMEEYEGLTILATNLSQNIDDAFVRRLQFIINFAKPRATERLQIWKGMFPPEAQLAPDVNFDVLAANVELPGGGIKNIVFHAGMAALDEGTAISMEHLVRAVRIEYLKENIPFVAANFGVQLSGRQKSEGSA